MKTLIATAAALTFTLAGFTASAQPAADGNTVTITGNQKSIALPESPRAMSELEFGKYAGSYELSNGDSIALFTRAGAKYAALHGQPAHELVAKSGHTFVAKDLQLEVTIDKSDENKISGEVLMAVPSGTVAAGTQQHVVSVALH